ncbi:hypothetical protein Z945_3235 [Sulfitobacter noctilucae]|nr:hypothetical protein Z945_3235 [Sulfitobacter noctilucae]
MRGWITLSPSEAFPQNGQIVNDLAPQLRCRLGFHPGSNAES